MSLFFALAAMFAVIWPGYAVLHLFGLRMLLGGAPVTLALATISASGASWLSIPIKSAAPAIATTLYALAVAGVVLFARDRRTLDRRQTILLVASFTIPLLLLPAILTDIWLFSVSHANDGWSYIAVADYLQHIPRGAEGGLSPLHQYASHLAHIRNGSSSLIALLSSVLHVRPDAVANLYCLLVSFAYCSALGAFAVIVLDRISAAVLFVVVAAYPNAALILYFANFDQLLFVTFLPALAAITLAPAPLWGRVIVCSVLISAGLYAYIELAVVGIACALSLPFTTRDFKRSATLTVLFLAFGALLTAPALPSLIPFLANQYGTMGFDVRPGEHFFDGMDLPLLGAVLSLLFALAVVGCWEHRTRWVAIISAIVVASLSAYFYAFKAYPYGSYKLLGAGLWLICFFAVVGIESIFKRSPGVSFIALALAVSGVALGCRFSIENQSSVAANQRLFSRLADEVRGPALLSVANPLANQWAVYYLANVPLTIDGLQSYMAQPHVAPLMARSTKADHPAFVIKDDPASFYAVTSR